MTASLIIACAIAWAVATAGLYAASRWGARKRQARRPAVSRWRRCSTQANLVCSCPSDFPCKWLDVPAALSEAEAEEIRARWLALYGKPGTAHHVTELLAEENPDA